MSYNEKSNFHKNLINKMNINQLFNYCYFFTIDIVHDCSIILPAENGYVEEYGTHITLT